MRSWTLRSEEEVFNNAKIMEMREKGKKISMAEEPEIKSQGESRLLRMLISLAREHLHSVINSLSRTRKVTVIMGNLPQSEPGPLSKSLHLLRVSMGEG